LQEWDSVTKLVVDQKGAFFYASNFSLGMNLLFHLTSVAASFMKDHPEYDISIEEIHHTEKKDMPSGTAITLAEKLLHQIPFKKTWRLNEESHQDVIGISAVRQTNVPGTHTVSFRSSIDTIQLSHTAHSRMGFALGAVQAGEWLLGKQGIFSMEDLLKAHFS
jgi:4-hydroxy-tetrahydrodipicolinate reductase